MVPNFRRILAFFTAWRQSAAARAQLRGLSDRQLADIGVSRAGIDAVVAQANEHHSDRPLSKPAMPKAAPVPLPKPGVAPDPAPEPVRWRARHPIAAVLALTYQDAAPMGRPRGHRRAA